MAPEILDPTLLNMDRPRHTPQSDVYSFAMCCWTVCVGILTLLDMRLTVRLTGIRSTDAIPGADAYASNARDRSG